MASSRAPRLIASMAITAERKKELIEEYATSTGDTGSPEVQIAVLTKRLEVLSDHFKKHPKDNHSRRGLLKIVARRKNLLKYLRQEDIGRYRDTVKRFNLRK